MSHDEQDVCRDFFFFLVMWMQSTKSIDSLQQRSEL